MNEKNRYVLLAIIIIVVVAIIMFIHMNQFDSSPVEKKEIAKSSGSAAVTQRIAMKEAKYPKAVELVNPSGFINTDNFTIGQYIGKKVILIDFWTFSCVNCIRTLPYLREWYDKYADDGLLIIGVHSPEFEFEKEYDNVLNAVMKHGIEYPVVLDNDFLTWRAYENRYWPRKYLIDIDGYIVYDHIGEGGYGETESKIVELLNEKNEVLGISSTVELEKTLEDPVSDPMRRFNTPELYLGYSLKRGNQLGNEEGWHENEITSYAQPVAKQPDKFYLEGDWFSGPDGMTLKSERGVIYLDFTAKEVNIVAGAPQSATVEVFIDGHKYRDVVVSERDLYNVFSDDVFVVGEQVPLRTITLGFSDPETTVFTFTFG